VQANIIFVQLKIAENVYVWLIGPRRHVFER